MARQSNGRGTGRSRASDVREGRGFAPSEFVNYELDKKQISEYRTWRDDFEAVLDVWVKLLEGGYRVNTKFDDYSDAFACFVLPPEGSDNSGLVLTGRGGNPYRALSEALYKHQVVFGGLWSVTPKDNPRANDPDF